MASLLRGTLFLLTEENTSHPCEVFCSLTYALNFSNRGNLGPFIFVISTYVLLKASIRNNHRSKCNVKKYASVT